MPKMCISNKPGGPSAVVLKHCFHILHWENWCESNLPPFWSMNFMVTFPSFIIWHETGDQGRKCVSFAGLLPPEPHSSWFLPGLCTKPTCLSTAAGLWVFLCWFLKLIFLEMINHLALLFGLQKNCLVIAFLFRFPASPRVDIFHSCMRQPVCSTLTIPGAQLLLMPFPSHLNPDGGTGFRHIT